MNKWEIQLSRQTHLFDERGNAITSRGERIIPYEKHRRSPVPGTRWGFYIPERIIRACWALDVTLPTLKEMVERGELGYPEPDGHRYWYIYQSHIDYYREHHAKELPPQ